jgi:ribose 5-phosphate isomerase B
MVIIGSDHSGIELKKSIIKYLDEKKIEYNDATESINNISDDYPDTSFEICKRVLENKINLGISICGTGIGTCIACNKVKGIRAALCMDEYMSEMAKKHNDANILCLGARTKYCKNFENVEKILQSFFGNFYEGGRHDNRLKKIKLLEDNKIEGELSKCQ